MKGPAVAKFLSDDHFTASREALASDAGFQSSISNVALGIQFVVTDGPDGDTSYYLDIADGKADTNAGVLDDADVSVTSDYATAMAISKGELNVQMAFITGKIKLGGNTAKVMMHQGVVNEFARVQSGLDLEY